MKYSTLIFDLDGTLLESLTDIQNAVNLSMEECGYSLRYDFESSKKLIGNGVFVLIDRAVAPLNLSKEEHDHFKDVMLHNYMKEQGRFTKPFPHQIEALNRLKAKGYKLFVVTNKPQFLVDEIIKKTYGKDFFLECLGQTETSIPKPNPKSINDICEKYNIAKKNVLYIGDSNVDMLTAKNAEVDSMLVTYGYDEYTDELKSKATLIANSIEKFESLLS